MPIENLTPIKKEDIIPYNPYYPAAKRNWLPLAISLYQEGRLEGQRPIEGGKAIPFISTWTVSSLPLEQTRCRLQFEGKAELSYEIVLQNNNFVGYLIEVIRIYQKEGIIDFPKGFYWELLKISLSY